MTKLIIITNPEKQYLGRAFLDQEKNVLVEGVTQQLKEFLEKVIKPIIEKGPKARRAGDKKEGEETILIEYLKPINEDDPFYLEAIAEELKNRGLIAFVLDQKRADLYVLIKQSSLPQEKQQKIIPNLRSLSNEEVKKLTDVLVEEKEELKKINQKYDIKLKELRKQNKQKWEEIIKQEKERLVNLINQKLKK